ncbi:MULTISPECIES: TetR/AcrR family transcriptional regulator [Streptomyces]|uniref:TetR/AcrR family transcriptional regulator n=1 Tax=Streptomyces TaxID=1883 RepID=UPI00163BB6FD|nr:MULTISPECIES: TetR/AcrR family transcriptional regulator [Streptomyces]MBC2874501.1 TetR/AcrR family transcriptional regulator [Streptomyces sp. TYQ1024]UBI36727.1 TetR/AcrR family transcriptional regulator [Streptomyces mobaraensis]UKW29319.1 TetR/AcrR family transcriptional regulator [Streptomyces sp. TYQ1024]
MTGRADANRRRILDVALAELLRDPEASMDQIARAAGVVRRTVYGHFPGRDALVAALVDDAAETVGAARAEALRGDPGDAAEALARAILAVWEIADGYRLLVSMAQRSVTVEGILRRLEPVRRESEALLRRGLEAGRFTSVLPAAALAYVHEQILFGLLQAVNDGLLPPERAGRSAAVTVLTAAGVRAEEAVELVERIAAESAVESTTAD